MTNQIEYWRVAVKCRKLGSSMDETLVFRKSRIAAFLKGWQITPKAIVPDPEIAQAARRVWMERKATKDYLDSEVHLISDLVRTDITTGGGNFPRFGVESRLEAVFDPRDRVTDVTRLQGLDTDEQIARIELLGTYVTAIADLQRDNGLRKIVSEYGFPSSPKL